MTSECLYRSYGEKLQGTVAPAAKQSESGLRHHSLAMPTEECLHVDCPCPPLRPSRQRCGRRGTVSTAVFPLPAHVAVLGVQAEDRPRPRSPYWPPP